MSEKLNYEAVKFLEFCTTGPSRQTIQIHLLSLSLDYRKMHLL